jgi:hypothetical protein
MLELCSREVTTVRITQKSEGKQRELTVTSTYLPYNSDKPQHSKQIRMSLITAATAESNSLLGVMAMHTIYGGVVTSTQEGRA